MNVFITGSTGFLGGEILVSLSKRTEINKIYCLVRAQNEADAFLRLDKVFAFHGDFFDHNKVIPVIGNLVDPNLTKQLIENKEFAAECITTLTAFNSLFSINCFVRLGSTKLPITGITLL